VYKTDAKALIVKTQYAGTEIASAVSELATALTWWIKSKIASA